MFKLFILILIVTKMFQVLSAALRWLEHDPLCRRRHCFEVLSNVRLPLISPQVLDEALKGVHDPSIQVALRTVRFDMVSYGLYIIYCYKNSFKILFLSF